MDIEKLQLIIKEYNKSKIQSEQEVRSKLIVPLLELLEYPSELRAEEFPIYGFEGYRKLPVKMVDFLLFSDENFCTHRKFTQENIDWVQNHSLLVVEAKKPGEIPSVLGQPLYYTMWSKAVAYLVIDGESIRGYYYNEIATDRKIIDCKLSELLEYEEIWAFSYQSILSIKKAKKCQILPELKKEQESRYIFDKELEEKFQELFGIKEKKIVTPKSTLEQDFENVEIENLMLKLGENLDLLDKYIDETWNEDDMNLNLIPYKYNHSHIPTKHFTIPKFNGITTVIFEVYLRIEYRTMEKYYVAEPIEFRDNIYGENVIESRTFYINDPQEYGNEVALFHFDKNNDRIAINTGILVGNTLKVTKHPSIMRIHESCYSDSGLDLSSASYNLESLSDIAEGGFANNKNDYEEKWFEADIRIDSPIIIDTNTFEQVKREVYYDEEEKCLKARIKLKPNKTYFSFKVSAPHFKGSCVPLTSIEKGKYYKDGQYGFPKDSYEAIRNFEDDGSAEAFFQIACIFRDDVTLKNDDMYFKYLCKAADLKCGNAIVELTLCVYNNETSIKEFKECVLLLLKVVNDNYALGNYILAYFTELCLIENKSSKDAFELYVKAALNDFKPAQVRLMCNSKSEIENAETNELFKSYMDSIQNQSGFCSYCIGCVYFFGIGIRKRKKKGLNLLLEAGYCGNIYAQDTLFEIFNIDSEYMNEKEATKWLEIISRSRTSVYVKLSNRLLDGIGCEVSEKNDKYAFSLLQKAVLNDNKIAINNLGWMYKEGRGCTIDYERARGLFEKAASLGVGASYLHLGEMYEKGLGVGINIDKAKEYYCNAIEMGNEKARKCLENIK